MGFNTDLRIDDAVLLVWRKHASPTPSVLFRFDDLHIVTGVDTDNDPAVEVGFRASVGDALTTLERAGLGWRAAVAAYADTRVVRGFSFGMLMRVHGYRWCSI